MAMNELTRFAFNAYGKVQQQIQLIIESQIPNIRNNEERNKKNDNQMSMSQHILATLTPLEAYFVSLQSLLIWEKPYHSAYAFLTLNCLFWFIVSWSRRFYSIVALVLFFVTLYKLWTHHIWPTIRVPPPPGDNEEGWTPIHPQVLSAPEISHYVNEALTMLRSSFQWLLNLRQTQHGTFCLIVSGILFIMALIGRVVPGVVIVYIIMLTAFLGPGVALYVIPSSWYHTIRTYFHKGSDSNDDETMDEDDNGGDGGDDDDDSLVPEMNEETMRELSLTSNRYDSLLPSASLLPNFLTAATKDDEDSLSYNPQLASELRSTLDKELGITDEGSRDDDDSMSEQLFDELRRSSNAEEQSNGSGNGSGNGNGIRFYPTHFNGNDNDTDDLDDEYELISESEIQNQQQQQQQQLHHRSSAPEPHESDL